MTTILSVIGTRPEAIKMAPVVKALQRQGDRVRSVVCVTGQHREMLDQALHLFDIKADFDLQVMTADQTLPALTARLIEKLTGVLSTVRPDWVLAQGDTTTVFAAAITAFYQRIRFGHVEAGLRTRDLAQPFPEEMNRRVADMLSAAWFAPTERARQVLLTEGADPGAVHVTGNTVVDALLDIAARPANWREGPLAGMEGERLVLVTAHRRESFGERFGDICGAIRDLADRFAPDGVKFVYPIHPNPNVRRLAYQTLESRSNVKLLEPLDYVHLVQVMQRAELILTDSGGIQEEAPTFGVPVLVMREATERPEGVEAGMVKLVGTKRAAIVETATAILSDPAVRARWPKGANPYGDGQAAGRIVSIVLNDSAPRKI